MSLRKRTHPSAALVAEHMAREARIFGPWRPQSIRGIDRKPPRKHRPAGMERLWDGVRKEAAP